LLAIPQLLPQLLKLFAAGIVPAAVIIIGIAFSNLAKDSTTALYPARFACEDNISID
jgi:glucose-6-phosphate 1-dehydrogenase